MSEAPGKAAANKTEIPVEQVVTALSDEHHIVLAKGVFNVLHDGKNVLSNTSAAEVG